MKRCSIVIHSVSGNCYIIGSYLKEALSKRNVDVRLFSCLYCALGESRREDNCKNQHDYCQFLHIFLL